jgi:hypothetical protein
MRRLTRCFSLLLVAASIACDSKGPEFFLPGATSPQSGNLAGTVLSNSIPLAGANVVLSGTPSRSMVTAANGLFSFTDLTPGPYTITTTLSSYTCLPVNVTVERDQTTPANVICIPVPGSITGTVRVDGIPRAGVDVILTQGATAISSIQTALDGTYTIPNIPPGTYSASITAPANTTCTSNPQNVTVVSAQAAAANFDCTSIGAGLSAMMKDSGSPILSYGASLRPGH